MQKSVNAIICHHRGTLVDNAIESLLKSLEVSLEIIVATSSKPDEKRLKKKYPGLTIFFCEGGPAKKRNVATRFATHDYLAFFDDDVEVTPYALFYMSEALRNPSVGMVYGKLLNMEHRNRLDEAGSFLTWSGFLFARCESGIEDSGQFEDSVCVLAGKSAACIVRRNIFWKAGGFDESFGILGEETDLSWRIWLLGKKVMYCPKSVTYHAFNTRFKPLDFYVPRRIYYNGCRNYMVMLIACLEPHNLPIPLLCQTFVWLSAAMGFIVTGKFEAGWNILKAFYYLATNFRSIIKKRKIVQNFRVIPDRELLPMITHNPGFSYFLKRFFHYVQSGRHG